MKKFLCSVVNRAAAILGVAFLVVSFVLLPVNIWAQSAVANLSGTVVDPNGQVIPGVAVTIANPSTGFRRETTTNDDGVYTFLNLAPDTYTLTARRDGFTTAENRDVVLNVNDKRSLRIQLSVGDINAVVQVTGEASLVDESPAVAMTIDRQFMENLPLNGRSFQALIQQSPGVVVAATSNAEQGQFNVNGNRAASNSFSVDGVSANFGGVSGSSLQQSAGGSLPSLSAQGGTNSLVSVDAVQEFTIQTSTYSPEFGRQPGAQISILTRSGTNEFHGSIFEYFRTDALDANDWFANSRGLPKPELRMHDYGGVIGGPVYLPRFGEGVPPFWSGKDRTFFFFSYEALPLSLPQTRLSLVPSNALRQNPNLPTALRPFLNAYPVPNGPETFANTPQGPVPTGLAEFNTTYSDESDLTSYSIRIDHNFSPKFQVFGRFSNAPSSRSARAGVASVTTESALNTRTFTAGSIWSISSKLINDLRFNYSTQSVRSLASLDNFGGAVPVSASAFFTTPQPFTEEDSLLQFNVIGGGTLAIGREADNKQRQINIVDHITFVKGTHSFKFGGDYRRLTPIFAPLRYGAQILFLDARSLVVNPDSPGSGRPLVSIIQANQAGTLSFTNIGFYGQDTWKVSPRLTLTYGLRWDVDLPPSFGGGLQPVSVTSAGFTDPTMLGLAPEGTPLYETTYNNFAPRIGAAYKLRDQNGWETVVRGGFGVFYDLASQGVGQQLQAGSPPFGNTNQVLGPLFGGNASFPLPPAQAIPPAIGRVLPFQNTTVFDPELKQPYTLQWNLAVEQSLGAEQSFTAAYVAAAGRRLLRGRLVSGNILPPGGVIGVNTPIFFNPLLVDNTSTSDYHSMQLQFQRRLSRGLQALASYTWAHSIDTASTGQSSIADARLGFNDVDLDRGNSNFDIRHTFTTAVSYNIPAPFENKALRAIFGGWALDNIFIARSAPPLTVISSAPTFASAGGILRADLVPGVPVYLFGDEYPGGKRLNPAAFTTPPFTIEPVTNFRRPARQGTLGRNALRGFGAWQLDTALRRQFSFTEDIKLQVRAEFFNILNNPNFGPPNSTLPAPPALPGTTFGRSNNMLGRSLGQGAGSGGFNPLFQIGGPRSTQLSVKLLF